jgi:hypothetical protein
MMLKLLHRKSAYSVSHRTLYHSKNCNPSEGSLETIGQDLRQESEPNRGRRFPGFDGRIDGVTAHSGVEIQTLDPVNLQWAS